MLYQLSYTHHWSLSAGTFACGLRPARSVPGTGLLTESCADLRLIREMSIKNVAGCDQPRCVGIRTG